MIAHVYEFDDYHLALATLNYLRQISAALGHTQTAHLLAISTAALTDAVVKLDRVTRPLQGLPTEN